MLAAALIIIAKTWKQPKCPLTHDWVKKMCPILGFPGGSGSKESTNNAEDLGLILGLGRPPGEGNSHPLQYSSLENFMDLGACKVCEELTHWKRL